MIFKMAIRGMSRNLRRTFLVLFTVGLGSAGLLGFHGMNSGMLKRYKEVTIRMKYGHGQFFRKGFRGKVHEKPWELWIPQAESISTKIKNIPGVNYVFPRLSFQAIASAQGRSINSVGLGVRSQEETQFFNQLKFTQGRHFIRDTDAIALGSGLAQSLRVKPGESVTILLQTIYGTSNAAVFQVSGIFETGLKDFDDVAFRIELSKAQQLLDTDRAETIGVGLAQDEQWNRVSQAIIQSHPELEAIPFEVLDWVYYGNSVAWLKSQFGVFQVIVLLIVLLGVFNSVSVSIFERRREFGALRANGESRLMLFFSVCLEALLIGILGSIFGFALMVLVHSSLLHQGIQIPPAPGFTLPFVFWLDLHWNQALHVLALICGTITLGAVLAGIKTLRIPITDSLRAY